MLKALARARAERAHKGGKTATHATRRFLPTSSPPPRAPRAPHIDHGAPRACGRQTTEALKRSHKNIRVQLCLGALRSSARRPETRDQRSAATQQRANRRNIYRARIPERMPTVATPLASLGARARQSYCARFLSKHSVFLCSRFQSFDLE